MNIFKLIGELVVIYVLYNVVFNFFIPLYKASKQMKGTFKNMNEKMHKQQNAHQGAQNADQAKKQSSDIKGDYIDYEEIN